MGCRPLSNKMFSLLVCIAVDFVMRSTGPAWLNSILEDLDKIDPGDGFSQSVSKDRETISSIMKMGLITTKKV